MFRAHTQYWKDADYQVSSGEHFSADKSVWCQSDVSRLMCLSRGRTIDRVHHSTRKASSFGASVAATTQGQ